MLHGVNNASAVTGAGRLFAYLHVRLPVLFNYLKDKFLGVGFPFNCNGNEGLKAPDE